MNARGTEDDYPVEAYGRIWQPEHIELIEADDVDRSRFPIGWFALVVLGFWLLVVPAANAYVDPGTGSFIFQVLIGAFLGAAVAVKVFWKRIWGFITRKPVGSTPAGAANHDRED
jgi:hypothetical protein